MGSHSFKVMATNLEIKVKFTESEYPMSPRGCCKTTPMYFILSADHFSCCRVGVTTHLVKKHLPPLEATFSPRPTFGPVRKGKLRARCLDLYILNPLFV